MQASRGQQEAPSQEQQRQPGEDADRRGRRGLGDLLGPIGLTLGGKIGKGMSVRAAGSLCCSFVDFCTRRFSMHGGLCSGLHALLHAAAA